LIYLDITVTRAHNCPVHQSCDEWLVKDFHKHRTALGFSLQTRIIH